jgi:uncharacterized protein DUF4038
MNERLRFRLGCGMTVAVWFVLTACAFGQAVYPLKLSANKRYFIDHNNQPFLLVGDSPQSLIAVLDEAGAGAYFADRQVHGFNAVWINLLCDTYTFCKPDGTTSMGSNPSRPVQRQPTTISRRRMWRTFHARMTW